ncbi:hypothetical protein, partial [Stenotrophomonas maltophilia]|uniref:hypothetical protein n=1 Tax=Stenotrophomonas maltophilia TaxID=40324 RepID=UPI003CCFE526
CLLLVRLFGIGRRGVVAHFFYLAVRVLGVGVRGHLLGLRLGFGVTYIAVLGYAFLQGQRSMLGQAVLGGFAFATA